MSFNIDLVLENLESPFFEKRFNPIHDFIINPINFKFFDSETMINRIKGSREVEENHGIAVIHDFSDFFFHRK